MSKLKKLIDIISVTNDTGDYSVALAMDIEEAKEELEDMEEHYCSYRWCEEETDDD
jgi:hypothetical protein